MNNSFDDEQKVAVNELKEAIASYDKLIFNVTTLQEWRTKWLVAFYHYMYEVKNVNGELIDPKGEVLSFWNARKINTGGIAHGPNIFVDTHIVDEQGTVVYVIPSTVTSVGTTITDLEVEPSLYAMISYAMTNPIPAFREAEANAAIVGKFNKRKENYTDAYTKHLLINHMFIKEGYPALVNEDGTLNTNTIVDETMGIPDTNTKTPSVPVTEMSIIGEFSDDFDF